MEKQDLRLVYVYDSTGTLVNGKPFVGVEQFRKFMSKFHSDEFSEGFKEAVMLKALSKCRSNGDMFLGHYFRNCPTTVFKSKVKFYTLKLKK